MSKLKACLICHSLVGVFQRKLNALFDVHIHINISILCTHIK